MNKNHQEEEYRGYTYATFGAIRAQSGADLNRITYTAREALGDSAGLYYYRFRTYNPALGRFLSEDPLGFIDGPNRYIYVRNSPVVKIDPFGLRDTPWPFNGSVNISSGCSTNASYPIIDMDKKSVVKAGAGYKSPVGQDMDFIKVNGVWLKIGANRASVDKDGNCSGHSRGATAAEGILSGN